MIRYTLLRYLIFFGCLCVLWVAGLRDTEELPWLIVISALGSMLISFVVLRPMREQVVRDIQARQQAKAEARAAQGPERRGDDETAEDGTDGRESYR